ncbi:MAG: RNA polymerase sigma factor [Maribacter sp.]|nr:RNA polymerase sigma factor [Maribacter sp.]
MTIDQLIKSCIKKDRKAQEALYDLYKNKLFPVCLKYCHSHTEAEDHLHDAFIEIFDKIKNYKGKGSFEGWMKRITINKAIDKYKKNMVFSLDAKKSEALSTDITIEEKDLPISWEALMVLIQELPNQYRIIFNLYELDGYRHKEIASLLKISESTSKSNLHRAKSILKQKILSQKSMGTLKKEKNHGK